MAEVDIFGNVVNPHEPPQPPAPSVSVGAGNPAWDANPRDAMAARDKDQWLNRLRGVAQGLNFGDFEKAAQEELSGVISAVTNERNIGADPDRFLREAEDRLRRRGAPTPGGATNIPGGGQPTQPPLGYVPNQPGNQFTDPYTSYLETLAKQQIESLQGRNAQMEKLMGFLDREFERLSNSPTGFTPQELATLNTQAFEPITAQRDITQRRILERAGLRGLLPSSGVVQSEAADTDRAANALMAQAGRDISIQGINRQRQNLQDALNLGQMAVAFPDQRNAQALNIAQMLYQLPRNALQDALAVTNASSPTASLPALMQLLQLQTGQTNVNNFNNAALWNWLGQILQGAAG